jgi:alanine racemase
MLKILNILGRSSYQPLNRIWINKNTLLSNYQTLNELNSSIQIAPVLKSNAYGHGLINIARILQHQNPPFFCVDSLPEANILRKTGIKSEILIMGSIAKTSLKKRLPYHLTIINKESLQNFKELQQNAQVHLFIDTGMNREGVRVTEIPEILAEIKTAKLNLVGVMTHLALAYDESHPLTKLQLKNFQQAKELVLKAGLTPKWFHIGGSDSLPWIPHDLVNIVRTGRLLYGVQTNSLKNVKPILQLESSIVQIKQIKKGESVGYSATFKAQNDLTIAVIPIGYNDGVDRRLSNKGVVVIKEQTCPIVGLISMNMTVVDISKIPPNIAIGDKIIIFSNDESSENSIEKSALKADTNPSDLLVGLHASVRREVI